MKRMTLYTLIALILAPVAFAGGPDVSGVTTLGPVFRAGEPTWVGFSATPEASVWMDTLQNRSLAIRSGYYFENRPGLADIERAEIWSVYKQGLPWWKFYIGLGSGMITEFKDGNDLSSGGLKLEVGAKFYKDFGAVVGVNYLIGWGDVVPYFGLDLTPRL